MNLSAEEEPLYQKLFALVDSERTGRIEGKAAVQFLRQSKVPDSILREIWALATAGSHTFLDRPRFYVALKLVAQHQVGHPLALGTISSQKLPLPVFEGVTHNDPARFREGFQKLAAGAASLTAGQAHELLSRTGVPAEQLKKVWELIDPHCTGAMGEEQFLVAMTLITDLKEKGRQLPQVLPGDLKQMIPVNAVGDTFQYYRTAFRQLTGGASQLAGTQATEVLRKTQLQPEQLQKLWGLIDTSSTGNMDENQFVVAMALINNLKTTNGEIPNRLPENLEKLLLQREESVSSSAASSRPLSPQPLRNSAPARVDSLSRSLSLMLVADQQELRSIQEQNALLEDFLSRLTKQKAKHMGELLSFKGRASAAAQQLNSLQRSLAEERALKDTLQGLNEELQTTNKALRDQVAAQRPPQLPVVPQASCEGQNPFDSPSDSSDKPPIFNLPAPATDPFAQIPVTEPKKEPSPFNVPPPPESKSQEAFTFEFSSDPSFDPKFEDFAFEAAPQSEFFNVPASGPKAPHSDFGF